MRQCKSWLTAGIAILIVLFGRECQSKILVQEMRCECMVKLQGVDVAEPKFSWKLESTVRGDCQSAYRVVASENIDRLNKRSGVLWDSGKVHSSNSLNIRYSGRTLSSNKTIFWSVEVWDKNGKSTGKSGISSFTTGLMKPSDWHGTWIRHPREPVSSEAGYYAERPAPLLRKEFAVKKTVKRATAFAAGLGYYELHLNGKKAGDQQFGTAWTTFSKRVLYSTYDVTGMLKKGANAVGFILGNGWYYPLPLRMWGHLNVRESLAVGDPRALLELRIEYTDGTTQNVITDPSWRAADSPILRNSIYLGELYDARNELPGWDKASFYDTSWKQAAIASEPIGKLCSQTIPPVRVTRVMLAKSISEIKPGVFIYDMGQNFAGSVTLRVSCPAGRRVILRYGELLYPDGTLNVKTSCAGQIKNAHGGGGPGWPDTAEQTDTYILRGSGEEVYTPRFTWHGFRYVEVTGYPGRPTPESIIGNRMNTDVSEQGMEFTCSDDLLNRIHQMTQWTLLSNLFIVQSDCPHWERFGYGGDIAATSEMAMLHFDMSRFYLKAVIDLEDAVRPNGGFTETAPYVGIADEGWVEVPGRWGGESRTICCSGSSINIMEMLNL